MFKMIQINQINSFNLMHSEIPNGKDHIVARSEDRYCQGTVRVLG